MHPDPIPGRQVHLIICFNFDDTAVAAQSKMVRGRLLTESHDASAAAVQI